VVGQTGYVTQGLWSAGPPFAQGRGPDILAFSTVNDKKRLIHFSNKKRFLNRARRPELYSSRQVRQMMLAGSRVVACFSSARQGAATSIEACSCHSSRMKAVTFIRDASAQRQHRESELM
jgi:hypothetical protein